MQCSQVCTTASSNKEKKQQHKNNEFITRKFGAKRKALTLLI